MMVVVFAAVEIPVLTPAKFTPNPVSFEELSRQVSVTDVSVPVTESNVGADGGVAQVRGKLAEVPLPALFRADIENC